MLTKEALLESGKATLELVITLIYQSKDQIINPVIVFLQALHLVS